MIRQVYLRCSGGHYLASDKSDWYCPVDGSTQPWFRQVTDLAAQLGNDVSHATLHEAGVPAAALQHVVIMEFLDQDSASDAVLLPPDRSDAVADRERYPLREKPFRLR
jgi:hypothetical protein